MSIRKTIPQRLLLLFAAVVLVAGMSIPASMMTADKAYAAEAKTYAYTTKSGSKSIAFNVSALKLTGVCCDQGVDTRNSGTAKAYRVKNNTMAAKVAYYYGYKKGLTYSNYKNNTTWQTVMVLMQMAGHDEYGNKAASKEWSNYSKLLSIYKGLKSKAAPPDTFQVWHFITTNGAQDFVAWKMAPSSKLTLVKTSTNTSISSAGGYNFSGIKYQVYMSDKKTKVGTLTCDKSGKTGTLSSNLAAGTYYAKEIATNKYYRLGTNWIKVTVGEGKTATFKDSDTPKQGYISIAKQSKDPSVLKNGYNFSGIQYTIYKADGKTKVQTLTLDKNGKAKSKALPIGTYKIKEAKTNTFFKLNTKVYSATVTDATTKTVKPVDDINVLTGTLVKTSKDAKAIKAGYNFSGIQYTVYKSDKKTKVKTLTLDKNGKAKLDKLAIGTYYVKETKTNGYFKLDSTMHQVKVTATKPGSLTVSDAPEYGAVKAVKTIADGKSTDEVFTLILKHKKDSSITYKINVPGNGTPVTLNNVLLGDYTVIEDIADDSKYEDITGKKTITVTKASASDPIIINWENKEIPPTERLSIVKRTSDGSPVKGFQFKITGVLKNSAEITEEKAMETIDPKLVLDDPDNYDVTEWDIDDADIDALNEAAKNGETGTYELHVKATATPKNAGGDTNPTEATTEPTQQDGDDGNNNAGDNNGSDDGNTEPSSSENNNGSDNDAGDNNGSDDGNTEPSSDSNEGDDPEPTEEPQDDTSTDGEITLTVKVELGEAFYDETLPGYVGKVENAQNKSQGGAYYNATYNDFDWLAAATKYKDVDTGDEYSIKETDDKGAITIEDGIAPGVYTVEEVMTEEQAARYERPEPQTKELVLEEGQTSATVKFTFVNKRFDEKIGTTAVDSETKDHIANADGSITIIDTVSYSGLSPEKEYTMEGVLMDKTEYLKTDNKDDIKVLVDADGKEVKSEPVKFTPEESDGTIEIPFTFNGENLGGTSVVAYETLLDAMGTVTEHADPDDPDQTVDIPDVKTTATDDELGGHYSNPDDSVKIVDKVQYTNLIPGKEYEVSGVLVDKKTGEPLKDANGEEITASKPFTAEDSDGTVELVFEFDGRVLAGTTAVVFEELTLNGVIVGEHKDPEDPEQTIVFPNPKYEMYKIRNEAASKNNAGKYGFVAGDTVTYDVVIKNTGNVDLTMDVSDEFVEGENYFTLPVVKSVKGATQNSISDDKNTVNITVEAGKTATVVYAATVKNGAKEYLAAAAKDSDSLDKDGKDTNRAVRSNSPDEKDGYRNIAKIENPTYPNPDDPDNPIPVPENPSKPVPGDDDAQTPIRTPDIGTYLTDENASKTVAASSLTVLIDKIKYSGFTPGETYYFTGTLIAKDTGDPLVENGEKITAKSDPFVAKKSNGTAEVKFVLDTTKLIGKEIVAFENAYNVEKDKNGNPTGDEHHVAKHEDLNDPAQTVVVKGDAKLVHEKEVAEETTAKGKTLHYTLVTRAASGTAINVVVADEVKSKNFKADLSTIKVTLNGHDITKECKIKQEGYRFAVMTYADLAAGKDVLKITYSGKAENNKKVNNVSIATADNTNKAKDKEVIYPPEGGSPGSPKTGQSLPIILVILGLIIAGAGTYVVRNRKKLFEK